MSKQFLKSALGWGFVLWLIGYILGFVFFALAPKNLLGWVIMPFGIVITLWVLYKKIPSSSIGYFLGLGVVWTIIAIICDYFFLVKMLNPIGGYYKADVCLYYALTFILPLFVGWRKHHKTQNHA